MNRRLFIKVSSAALAAGTVLKPFYIRAESKKYVFGFSQATIAESWRVQFNKDMKKEAEKHPEVARVLIDHGADVHLHSTSGFTPLLFAAQQGDMDSARMLLEAGANVNEAAPEDRL